MSPVIFKDSVETLISKASAYMDVEGLDLVRRAYEFCNNSIRAMGLVRFSGEPAIIHPIAVAEKLAEWRLDAPTVAAGLLHDIIEDPEIRLLQLRATFKDEISFLVDAVTKLKKFELAKDVDANTAYFHKMFLAVASDIRVALIKLADRQHNMSTLEYLPAEKRRNNCIETQAIFIPLAKFLGIDDVRFDLEDYTFMHYEPRRFEELSALAGELTLEEDHVFEPIIDKLHRAFQKAGIPGVWRRIVWNAKTLCDSVEAYTPGRRATGLAQVTVPAEADCYPALGAVHSQFQNTGRIVDAVEYPDVNLKRWIVTELLDDEGSAFQVRIVSEEMAHVNRLGVVPYLVGPRSLRRTDFLKARIDEIQNLIETSRQERGAHEERALVELMTKDLLQNEIFVITPDHERISMPHFSTVLDYAFRVGNESGEQFSHAYVNNKLVPISYELKSCDQIRIVTNDKNAPMLEWLQHAHTPKARMRVMHHLQTRAVDVACDSARRVLLGELRRTGLIHEGVSVELDALIEPLLDYLNLKSTEEFLSDVGYGKIKLEEAIDALREQRRRMTLISEIDRVATITGHAALKRTYPSTVAAAERPLDGPVSLCPLCTPLPGDEADIAGSAKKYTLHRTECRRTGWRNVLGKRTRVQWGETASMLFPVRLKIKSFPSDSLHGLVVQIVSARGGRVLSSLIAPVVEEGIEGMEFLMDLPDAEALEAVCADVMKIKDIIIAIRI